jgi:hypothetical protein
MLQHSKKQAGKVQGAIKSHEFTKAFAEAVQLESGIGTGTVYTGKGAGLRWAWALGMGR